MSREKEFTKNTIILLIGKFCTQFISLLLIPLYTHYLITSDYGNVDLIQTYISLFVPILTLKLDSVAFRFLIDVRDRENEKKKIISNILSVTLLSTIVFSILYIIFTSYFSITYRICTFFNILILMLSNVFLQFLRGLGKNKEYTITSIITAFITVVMNFVLIIGFKYNASSILISSSIANVVAIAFIIKKINLLSYFSFKLIDKHEFKKMLVYSIPMIPNQLSWWIVNVSDRTLISIFLGVEMNGIYAISCKFSNIINTIFSVFSTSWQETASLHINDENKDEFFSEMINKMLKMFSGISIMIVAILPFVYSIIIGEEYLKSFEIIPILVFGNIFNIIIGLIGGLYVAMKRIKEIANTTIISAIINIVINFLFIRYIGLYAAAISTLVAYLAMSIYRYYDVRKYIKIKISKIDMLLITSLFIMAIICYQFNNITLNIVLLIISVIISIILNYKLIIDIIFKIKTILRKLHK